MDRTVQNLLFCFLFSKKFKAPLLSTTQEELIFGLANKFLISGFILEGSVIRNGNRFLSKRLIELQRLETLKYIALRADLERISSAFNRRKINFVVLKGMALNSMTVFKPGLRSSRDIDLLVSKKDIKHAYDSLKALGFRYRNKNTKDTATIFSRHHFPLLTNDQGSFVELHWRVTKKGIYKTCPLTERMLDSSHAISGKDDIRVPSLDLMAAHCLYHGIVHHKLTHGPVFLFDLASIFKFRSDLMCDESIVKKLDLADKYTESKLLIDHFNQESSFSRELESKISNFFPVNDLFWYQNEPEEIISRKLSVSEISAKLSAISNENQVAYLSLDYAKILLKDFFSWLRKFLISYKSRYYE